MPAFIRGVINLRGSVVPVIDLSARFGGKTTEVAPPYLHRHRRGQRSATAATTSASWSMPSPRCSKSRPAKSNRRRRSAPRSAPTSSSAWARSAGKFVIILNIDKVLSVEEIAMLASVAGEGTSPASASSV
jgi:purine-binding chemotaxis protein CheW